MGVYLINFLMIMKQQATIVSVISSFFKQFDLLVGSPKQIYKPSQNKVVLQVPYFGPNTRSVKQLEDKKRSLAQAIARNLHADFQRPNKANMEVELQLISLRYPFLDSSILAQYLALNAGKYNFLRLKKKVFTSTQCGTLSRKSTLPRCITGVKMELAGRLTTQQSIPRKTVSNAHKGSFAVVANAAGQPSSMDYHKYSSKNKLGAYTMKV